MRRSSKLTLLIGMHGLVKNGYAVDTGFSTFVTTTRSKDLDALLKGSCPGHWPKDRQFLESRLKFGEIVVGGPGGMLHLRYRKI